MAELDSDGDGEVSDDEVNSVAGFTGGGAVNSDGDQPVEGSDEPDSGADDAVTRSEFMGTLYNSIKDRFVVGNP